MKKTFFVIGAIGIITIIFIALGVKFSSMELFKYNLMDIIMAIAASFGLYYLTKITEDKRNKNIKIEELIDVIEKKLTVTFSDSIDCAKTNRLIILFTDL